LAAGRSQSGRCIGDLDRGGLWDVADFELQCALPACGSAGEGKAVSYYSTARNAAGFASDASFLGASSNRGRLSRPAGTHNIFWFGTQHWRAGLNSSASLWDSSSFSRFSPFQFAPQDFEIGFLGWLYQAQTFIGAAHANDIGGLHGDSGLPVEGEEDGFGVAGEMHFDEA